MTSPEFRIANTKSRRRSILITALLIILLAVSTYFVVDAWRAREEAARLAERALRVDATPEERQAGEGRDEKTPAEDALENYTVAPDQPRALYIDTIDVAARILPMGVNPDGSMQAPINIFDSGWYTGSAVPGTPGAAVIDAHASGPSRKGLFAYLDTLKEGDTLEVEMGDGARYAYRIVHLETVDLDKVDMEKLLRPYGDRAEGLNLITCAGSWLRDSRTFDQRVLVYAERA